MGIVGKDGAGGELVSLCKHHTYTVFEAMLRISFVMLHVKCIALVYPAVYPNVCHMNESLRAI